MLKKLLSAILFTGCITHCIAQTETNDVKNEKTFEHCIGVQMNDLIRQVFNFNSSTATTVTNQYLFTYNINLVKSGWGLRVGVGYNYNSSNNNDGITATTSKIDDVHARFGIEKRFILSEKWSTGVGLDGLINLNDDNTTNTTHSFDTTTTTTKTMINSSGGGAMGWLRYHLTSKIVIGTEASFYYTSGTQKNTIDITTIMPGTFPPSKTTETKSSPAIAQGVISLPVVFYLSIKF